LNRLQPRTKERRREPIPEELRQSLREVYDLIKRAKHDSDIVLDFDDAIQVGAICGGRIGKENRPYVITYYPTADSDRAQWQLALHRTEIEDIADGRMTEIAMYCCTSSDCRRKFRELTGRCVDCDYVPDSVYAHLPVADALGRLSEIGVNGLSEKSTKQDVLLVLGQPNEEGGGPNSPDPGFIRPWIKYHLPGCQLRFELGERGQVLCVTFLPKDWEPGK
jgi:hypothetical protein